MGINLDTSEMRDLGLRIKASGPLLAERAGSALVKTAYDIEADAKALAPVDTGNLMNSISTDITGEGSPVVTAQVGPTAEYGIYQEFGTSTQAGTPYMGPAFDRRVAGLTAAIAQLDVGI